MVDYKNGKVYRLCDGSKTIYVGSTAQPLAKRLHDHRFQKSSPCYKRYDIRIVLIEDWPCENRRELEKREQHYIDHAKDLFPEVELKNRVRAFMTHSDYCEHHKRYDASEKGQARNKRYWASEAGKASRLRDKEKVKCECGSIVSRCHFKRHQRSKCHAKRLNLTSTPERGEVERETCVLVPVTLAPSEPPTEDL